jgi:hypothetical protein
VKIEEISKLHIPDWCIYEPLNHEIMYLQSPYSVVLLRMEGYGVVVYGKYQPYLVM